jgi:hypothetical protein
MVTPEDFRGQNQRTELIEGGAFEQSGRNKQLLAAAETLSSQSRNLVAPLMPRGLLSLPLKSP